MFELQDKLTPPKTACTLVFGIIMMISKKNYSGRSGKISR
jgi:hypothetical protein